MSKLINTGIVMQQLGDYMDKYQISFQFWGEGNNNVFIGKDDVDLYSSGNHETPLHCMIDSLEYLDKINRKKRDYIDLED